MKLNKSTTLQILLAVLSCPIILDGVFYTWKLDHSLCFLLILFSGLFLGYIFYPWHYKKWGDCKAGDNITKKLADRLKSFLAFMHSAVFLGIILIPVTCSVFAILQVFLPKYYDDMVVNTIPSYSQTKFEDTLKPLSITINDSLKNNSNVSYLINSSTPSTIAYPTAHIFQVSLPKIFSPFWSAAWGGFLLLLIVSCMLVFIEIGSAMNYNFEESNV